MVKGSSKYESVGGPIPNTEMKVVDPEIQSSLAARQTGEILMRGPQVRERERELSGFAVCILIFGVVILCDKCGCHFLSAHSPN
jgi:predicted HNH restriction endonuclease